MARSPASAPPPLSDRGLRGRRITTPTHEPSPAPIAATFYLAGGRDRAPRIEPRVTRVPAQGRPTWRVDVVARDVASLRPRMAFRRVRRNRGRATSAASLPAVLPSRPRGTAVSVRPRPAPVDRPVRLAHRGRRVTPLVVLHPDGRRAYQDSRFPWRCVCRVLSGSKGGSGVMIGPRHVLTASHAIDWRAREARVHVNLFDGRDEGFAVVTSVWAYTQIDDPDGLSLVDEDYAVCVLDAYLGDRVGWLGSRVYDAGWDLEVDVWKSIGYAPDVAGGARPCFQTRFTLDEDELDVGGARALRTKVGDFVEGQSGSPVFGFWPNGPFVVAVTSAESDDANWFAAGEDLVRLVADARAGDP